MATETQAGAQRAPASGRPLLRVRGATKAFGPVQALSDVSLEVHAGEVVALVGDNGAGKSTLIKAISGVGPADAGEFECGGTLDEIAMEKESRRLLDSLAVRTLRSVRSEVGSLSGGQRQTVAIARSMLGEPRMVILDEPTAALGVAQTEQVLQLVRRLREQGLGVIIVSHNLADVFAVADRIVVLRLGRNAGDFAVDGTNQNEVVAAITGANVNGKGA